MIRHKVIRVPSFALLTQIAFWTVLWGFILSLSAVVLDWPQVFYRSVFAMMCHLINFYFFYSFLIPVYFEKGKYLHSIVGFAVLLAVITPVRMSMERFFIIDRPAFNFSIGANARVGFIIFSEVTIAAFASLLRLAVSREHMKLKMNNLEKSKLETELRFLKGQMSPHFLFNSINNIYSLVLTKSDHAPDALMKLSGLLRYLLYESEHKVALSREVEALKTYSDLFQLKFQEPLNVQWNIDLAEADRFVEPLTLVPILENAIKHSGLGIDSGANVVFSIHTNNNLLFVTTEN
ncbi:MAG: hypothetical protein C0490_17410, partial [Marivirga sp.]|nr:hypothetical protein [Marivirga sp.]